MHEVKVIMKNGNEFTVLCEDCEITTSFSGNLVDVIFSNPLTNMPLFLDVAQVAAVIVLNPTKGG